jgi:type IV secretion system protein VirB10
MIKDVKPQKQNLDYEELDDETTHEDSSNSLLSDSNAQHDQNQDGDYEEFHDDEDDDLEDSLENQDEYSNDKLLEAPKATTELETKALKLGGDSGFVDSDLDSSNDRDGQKPEVDNSNSKIAMGNKGNILILLVCVVVLFFVIRGIFSAEKEKEAQQAQESNPGIQTDQETISPPNNGPNDSLIKPQIPKLPDAPELVAPSLKSSSNSSDLPPPPVAGKNVAQSNNTNLSIPNSSGLPAPSLPPAVPPAPPTIKPVVMAEAPAPAAAPVPIVSAAKPRTINYKSAMTAFGGGGGGNDSGNGASLFALQRTTSGNQIGVSYIGDLNRIIAQGKIMDAVLETAISTDLQGSARALVTRDVYAEAGKNVLIQKGSRLIGTYSSAVTAGSIRIQIIWNRLIRPDGVDIAIASPGIDPLGRAGVAGQYDAKALALFANAAMTCLVQYGMAILEDRQAKKDGTFGQTNTIIYGAGTNNSSGSSGSGSSSSNNNNNNNNGTVMVQSKQPSQKSEALQQSAQTAVQVAGQIGQNYYGSAQPRILVDQGTKLKVFVQKDIVFAGDSASQSKIVK